MSPGIARRSLGTELLLVEKRGCRGHRKMLGQARRRFFLRNYLWSSGRIPPALPLRKVERSLKFHLARSCSHRRPGDRGRRAPRAMPGEARRGRSSVRPALRAVTPPPPARSESVAGGRASRWAPHLSPRGGGRFLFLLFLRILFTFYERAPCYYNSPLTFNHSFVLNLPCSDYWVVALCSLDPEALLFFNH